MKIIGVDLELEEFERTLERDRKFENIFYYLKKCNIFIILYTSLFLFFNYFLSESFLKNRI